MSDAAVKVYGADWCEDTNSTREELAELGVAYEYRNVDEDPEAKQWVLAHNEGKQRTPTVEIEGEILVEPDEAELLNALRGKGLVA